MIKIVTFLSDFGSQSGYPAAMKGVAAEICDARFIDITHEVEPQNVRAGAFVLQMVAPYFPAHTVHCAVIDPGVGTERRGLIVAADDQLFVGPDNGLLIPAAHRLGTPQIYEIQDQTYMRPNVSSTFHGRDIFAPVAAHLANRVPPEAIGNPIDDWVDLEFGQGQLDGDRLTGEIIYIDRFGNLITNIAGELLRAFVGSGETLVLLHKEEMRVRVLPAYGFAEGPDPLVTVGSHDCVEIAINRGDAAKALGLGDGDPITLVRDPSKG